MVAAVSGTGPQNPKTNASVDEHPKRAPLLVSDKDQNNAVANNRRKPKPSVVSSRYMSPSSSTSTSNSSSVSSSSSSSRRYPSPLLSRDTTVLSNAASVTAKRSVSVDRRRHAPAKALMPDLGSKHGSAVEISAASKLLVTSSRSLSVSFQGEAFSLPISKTKAAPPSPNSGSVRKGTPERRRTVTPSRGKVDGVGDQVENSKPSDQHRWPARNRLVNPLSRSLDCIDSGRERIKPIGSVNAIRGLQRSMIDERRPSLDRRLGIDSGKSDLQKAIPGTRKTSTIRSLSVSSDLTASDSDSVSSGSTSGVQDSGEASQGRIVPRGIAVSARFWQETNSRLRRLQDPGSPMSTSPVSKPIMLPKLRRYSSDGPFSAPQMMSSPVRGVIRPASPSKLMTPVGSSPLRGHSPSRVRNAVSTISNNFVETPSVLSFVVDVRRGKVGENHIVDAHLLRLLYNRHLQWRFVNARNKAVLLVQKRKVEKNLWNAWITISDLRDTVTKRRHRLQLLTRKMKLVSILKGQMSFLQDWASLEKDQSLSLLGAIEALKASTIRLPLIGGATADVQSLHNAIGSAVDVMQAMASSICSLLPVLEESNSLMTELSKVTAKERALLGECTYHISLLAAMQVRDSSLRTHVIQNNCVQDQCGTDCV